MLHCTIFPQTNLPESGLRSSHTHYSPRTFASHSNPMKHTSILFAALLCLLTASCNKADDTPTTTTNNYWKAGATTYKVNNYTKTGDMYYAYDTSFNGISFSFATFPTTDGTYTVVDRATTLGAGQVEVDVFGPVSGSTYFSTGSDHTVATVTVTSGKLKITLPDTWVKKATTDDSIKISANLGPLF